jgi:hypothetical protein
MVAEGDAAPDFTLPDQGGIVVGFLASAVNRPAFGGQLVGVAIGALQ